MTFDFELGGFGIEIKNENDYLELVDILEGLQKRAGIKYKTALLRLATTSAKEA